MAIKNNTRTGVQTFDLRTGEARANGLCQTTNLVRGWGKSTSYHYIKLTLMK